MNFFQRKPPRRIVERNVSIKPARPLSTQRVCVTLRDRYLPRSGSIMTGEIGKYRQFWALIKYFWFITNKSDFLESKFHVLSESELRMNLSLIVFEIKAKIPSFYFFQIFTYARNFLYLRINLLIKYINKTAI